MKKWLFRALGIVFILLLSVVALPFIFKDKLIGLIKEEINKNIVNAKVDFKKVDFTLLKSFPDFRLGLQQLSIDGSGSFEGLNLANIEEFDIDLDLMSVLRGDKQTRINGIKLVKPNINVLVLENGKANYQITIPDSVQKPASAFELKLQGYKVIDGNLSYEDRTMGLKLKMNEINHSGKGNFSDKIFDLSTKSDVGAITADYGGIRYLNKVNTVMDLILNIDNEKSYITIKDNQLSLNDLKIQGQGGVGMLKNGYDLNLHLTSSSSSFKQFMSLVPGVFTKDYSDVKAGGKFDMDLVLKGKYTDVPLNYPSLQFKSNIEGGSFQYPSLPSAISAANGKVMVNFPGGTNFDALKLNIPLMNMVLGKEPITFNFDLETPVSDPHIKGKFKGRLDLKAIQNAMKVEGMKDMSGILAGNVELDTRMSYVEKGQYDKVIFNGSFDAFDALFHYTPYPKVVVSSGNAQISPTQINLNSLKAFLGKSDITGTINIKNPLAYFLPKNTLEGNFNIKSALFDANEWLKAMETEPEKATGKPIADNSKIQSSSRPFDKFAFTLNASVDEIRYDQYKLKGSLAKGIMTPNEFKVDQLSSNIGANDIQLSGNLNHIFDYLFDNKTLEGNLKLTSKNLNMNDFMDNAPSSTASPQPSSDGKSAVYAPIKVPSNIKLMMDANIGQLTYSNMELKQCKGEMKVSDEKVSMENIAANLLGGAVRFDGIYDSKGKDKPTFDMDLGLEKMSFNSVFSTFNTIKMLAPIGAYIDGLFNTKLKLTGKLGDGLVPDPMSLNISAFINTLNGKFKNLKALEEIGNKLNISDLKTLSLNDTKNWVEVKNGIVELKEFNYNLKDMAFKIAGKHSLTQDMDYTIKTKIPRKLLEKNAVGAAASQGLDFLSKEASKLGVNINAGEFINVLINITGNHKNPKVSIRPTGSDGSSTIKDDIKSTIDATAQKLKDSVNNRVKEEISKAKTKADEELVKAKERANQEIQKAKDSLANIAKREVQKATDTLKNKVKDKVGEKATEILKDKTDKVIDQKGKDAINKAADKLKDFNPFKKKQQK